jgi:hypothetical protein
LRSYWFLVFLDVDPEADLLPAILPESFDVGQEESVPSSGRLLLRPEISLGSKYAGKKVSRKALNEDMEAESSASEAGSADEDQSSEDRQDGEGNHNAELSSEDNEEESGDESSHSHLRPKTLDEADKLQKELNHILAQEKYVTLLEPVNIHKDSFIRK